ncbi:MAG: hypothetical protein AB9891_09860 [Anaerolineaceae bacterium]
MAAPLIISSIFVLAVVSLCIFKPNAGRVFLGCFFLAMAFGVNGVFILTNPQGYVDYLSTSLLPLYRDLTAMTVALNPIPYGLLLMLFETAIGVLILSKGRWVKYGLIGTMVFVIVLAPVSVMQIPWLGLLIGQAYLITKTFDRSILEMILKKKTAV